MMVQFEKMCNIWFCNVEVLLQMKRKIVMRAS